MNIREIKFGINYLKKEMPEFIKIIYKTIQWISTVFGILVLYLPIPAIMQAHIIVAFLISNKVISSFCQYFGYDAPDIVTKNVQENTHIDEVPQVKNIENIIPEVIPTLQNIIPVITQVNNTLTKYGTF